MPIVIRQSEHYTQLLEEIVNQRHGETEFQLDRYFRSIPAMGDLPNVMVDLDARYFGGFPDHYEVNLVPIRSNDIAYLREQTSHLPPLELDSRKVERIQILVPLSDSAFETLRAGLETESHAVLRRPAIENTGVVARVNPARLRDLSAIRPSAFDDLHRTRLNIRLATLYCAAGANRVANRIEQC